jgi:hypothetical protein
MAALKFDVPESFHGFECVTEALRGSISEELDTPCNVELCP